MGRKQQTRRVCPVCQRLYFADPQRLLWGRQTTCSRKCSYRLRAQKKTRLVSFSCAVCGKDFRRPPSQVKDKYGAKFCSRACHYAGRSLGLSKRVVRKPYCITAEGRAAWKEGGKKTAITRRQRNNYIHSEVTKAKLSEAAARQLARSQGIFTSSKIEAVVARELTASGVNFVRQRIFRDTQGRFAAVADFWLLDLGMVLEVNGTFWHADPRVYSGILLPIQQRAMAKYQRKKQLFLELGIRLGEVWEIDLKKCPGQAVLDAYTKGSSC